jgi:uncharacterized protein YaiL (DUF2058 family)
MLKAGLVNEKQAKKSSQQSRKSRKQRGQAASEDKTAQFEAERRAKAEKDRALNQEREEAKRQRDVENQVRQLIQTHRIERSQGEVPFSFQLGTAIRTMSFDQAQRDQLVAGTLALVGIGDAVELVPAATAQRIAQRDPTWVKCWNNAETKDAQPDDADDPYAGYEIPDDLQW